MKTNVVRFAAILFFTLNLTVLSEGQTTPGASEKSAEKNEQRQKDKPLKITKKPVVSASSCAGDYGIITLRVTFDKSAKITNIEIGKLSGCDIFDRNAVKAARAIKFEPAIKNGEPETVTKLIQYNFTRY